MARRVYIRCAKVRPFVETAIALFGTEANISLLVGSTYVSALMEHDDAVRMLDRLKEQGVEASISRDDG